MDPDVALPSVEFQPVPDQILNEHATNNRKTLRNSSKRSSLASALATPLPLSSPVKSPRKTPGQHRNVSSPQTLQSSPSVEASTPRQLFSERKSSTPRLQSRKSAVNQGISETTTPLRQTPQQISSNLFPLSSVTSTQPLPGTHMEELVQKSLVTNSTVAQDYFRKELVLHESAELPSKAVAIVHDACYGHRFSRPRTSKSSLSTIVERPERIHAGILGLSTAYVRMGDRHASGQHPPQIDGDPRTASTPPFKIRKTSRSIPLDSSVVTQVHGQKWMEELRVMCDSAEGKLTLNGKELVRPVGYGKDEGGNPLPTLHEGDLYLCAESLNALEGCLGGVCEGVDTVFGPDSARRAFVCIRPPGHHCSSNYPSGFCWLNNVHVGIMHAAMNHGLTHAAIIDFDLHHGDGSQTIAWDHNRKALHLPKNAQHYKRTPIGYFSLHDINSYPCEMGDEDKIRNASLCIENAHGQSIWNIHLEPWKNQADFWKLYKARYSILLDKTRIFLRHHTARLTAVVNGPKPKAAIFLSAGFDASEWEGEGMQRHKVNVPTDFYARLTADIVKLADEEGLGTDGRVISVLEGGYSDRALISGVMSHMCGLSHTTGTPASERRSSSDEDSFLTRKRMEGPQISGLGNHQSPFPRSEMLSFDADWWGVHQLELLELKVKSSSTHNSPRRSKEKAPMNYSSPTQSWNAKMTDHARERRSLSEQLGADALPEPEPVQPLINIDWATASFELSRLIIPTDRETLSCTHEDLNAEATRVRRERQSGVGLPTTGDQRMQLRDRKAKSPITEEELPQQPVRGSRRKTIGAIGDLPNPSLVQKDSREASVVANGRQRRRSSGASSITSALKSMDLGDQPQTDIPNHTAKSVESSRSRGSSVIPQKPAKAPVIKRTKIVGTAKAQPVKTKTSPKAATGTAPPVPRIPFGFLDQMQINDPPSNGIGGEENPAVQKYAVNAKSKTEDLDMLAGGMKKMSIKLKVPSPEENAAREKRAAEEKQKKVRAPRKPAVPKVPKASKMGNAKPASDAVHTLAPTESNPALWGIQGMPLGEQMVHPQQVYAPVEASSTSPNAAIAEIAELVQETGPQDLSPVESGIYHVQPPTQASIPAPLSGRIVMDAITEGNTAPIEGNISGPTPTCASVSSPSSISAVKPRSNLPVFTSRSPIRFGVHRKAEVESGRGLSENKGSENGIPGTSVVPKPEASFMADNAAPAPSVGTVSLPLATDGPTIPDSPKNAKHSSPSKFTSADAVAPAASFTTTMAPDNSIWEVPETPRH